MAISKERVNKNKANKPDPLYNVPENNPEHQSRPEDFHHPHPHVILYSSFEEARNACSLVFLKPGEAHTEFYKTNGVYHCVIAIGNISPGAGHLFVTDSGNEYSINDSLTQMYDQIVLMSKEVTAANEHVDELESRVDEFEVNLTEGLNEIRTALETLAQFEERVEGEIQEANARINEHEDHLNNLDDAIAGLDSSVKAIQRFVEEAQEQDRADIEDISTRVNTIEVEIEHFDSSIAEIQNLVDGFSPIPDASIPPLFHDDIMTVNLCCFTNGGWIQIFDHYDPERVAECTPANEYKTYVAGDSVDFVAHTNVGYEFIGWVKDADTDHIIKNDTIHVVFEDEDIPVIGKVVNAPYDPAMLEHGYTALYEKLHTIKIDIDVHVVNGQGEPVFDNDDIDVYINGNLCLEAPYYFKNNSSIVLKPIARSGHVFDYMTVNFDGVKHYGDYRNAHCSEDLQVYANFNEHWSKVTVDADPANHARIESQHGIGSSYIYGEEIDIKGVCDNDYEFVNWEPAHSSEITPQQLERDIVSGSLYSQSIVLKVNKSVSNYEITGHFRKIED